MLRLVFADLWDNARIWLGVVLVAAAAAVVGSVVAGTIATGVATGGTVALALYGVSGTMIVLSLATVLVVLGSVSGLAVTLNQRNYALWQVVGLRSGQIQTIVYAQLAVLAVGGAVVGTAVAVPLFAPLFSFGFAGSADLADVRPRFGPVAAVAVVALVVVLVVAGGSRGARQAGRTSVIQTLREAEVPAVTMTRKRWFAAAGTLLLLAAVLATLPGTATGSLSTPLLLTATLLAVLLTTLSPVFLTRLISAWTGLLPPGRSGGWYLARNATVSAGGRSLPAINPLMVSIALAGGLYAASASSSTASVSAGAVVLLLGGPVLLSVLGAAVGIFMSSRAREREVALLTATGATGRTITAAAAAEAVIYVVTAALLGAVVVAVTLLLGAAASGGGARVGQVTAAVAALGVAGLLLMVPATVVPTLIALRQEAPRVLAAE